MNLKQIESFLVLCEELHYGNAAERLEISQPALSQQIKALEMYLGVSLFKKQGRKIQLTKAGQFFLQRAAIIKKEMISVKEEIRYFQGHSREAVHLGASGSHFLMEVLSEFTDVFPDISLHVSEYSSKKTIQKIVDQQIDVGIVYQVEEMYGLASEVLFEDEIIVAIPKTHELANKKTIELRDLENQPLILLEKEMHLRQVIDKELRRQKIVPNIICELSNHYACFDYCQAQFGLVITVRSFLRNIPQDVRIYPIQDFPKKEAVMMVYRNELPRDETILYLFDKIRKISIL